MRLRNVDARSRWARPIQSAESGEPVGAGAQLGRENKRMFRRRRPLARAAIVGGTAYAVGKHVQGGRDADAAAEEAPPEAEAPAESTDDVYAQLEQLASLHEKGVLTDAEFEVQKHKLLERT
jgi:Short C-terminal domain